jgi:hypothetical protein
MLEIAGIIIGIIVGIFVLIFGGRGLIDIARERRERKGQTSLNTTAIAGRTETTTVDTTESTSTVHVSRSVGPLTEATTIGSQPLVGREKEMSFLRGKVDEALEGKGSVVFITGQAGIGKTRLAREVQDYARGKGCQWLEGKYEKTADIPYKAWADIVRVCLAQHEGRTLQNLAGPYAVQLAKIVPGAAGGVGEIGATVRSDPESERFQLFEGLTQFLVQVSHEAPLVLFLDDLQWASSIELVHHLSRNIGNQRVLALATYRDDELKEDSDLWQTVLAMNRERLFHSLPLKALDKGGVGQLMSGRVEGSVAPHLVEMIYRRTEGNPFFVEEVMRFLEEREAIVQTDAGWEVKESASVGAPDTVKAVINERIEQLGEDAKGTLQMASIVGREFPLRLLTGRYSHRSDGPVRKGRSCLSKESPWRGSLQFHPRFDARGTVREYWLCPPPA